MHTFLQANLTYKEQCGPCMQFYYFIILFSQFWQHSIVIHPGTGRCYWMSTSPDADWSTARTNCQSQDEDLVVMETEELWNFVMGKFRLIFNYTSVDAN